MLHVCYTVTRRHCLCQDGTLIIVYAANENDSHGKDVLMCTRSANHGASWDTPTPIDCTRFENRPPRHANAKQRVLEYVVDQVTRPDG